MLNQASRIQSLFDFAAKTLLDDIEEILATNVLYDLDRVERLGLDWAERDAYDRLSAFIAWHAKCDEKKVTNHLIRVLDHCDNFTEKQLDEYVKLANKWYGALVFLCQIADEQNGIVELKKNRFLYRYSSTTFKLQGYQAAQKLLDIHMKSGEEVTDSFLGSSQGQIGLGSISSRLRNCVPNIRKFKVLENSGK